MPTILYYVLLFQRHKFNYFQTLSAGSHFFSSSFFSKIRKVLRRNSAALRQFCNTFRNSTDAVKLYVTNRHKFIPILTNIPRYFHFFLTSKGRSLSGAWGRHDFMQMNGGTCGYPETRLHPLQIRGSGRSVLAFRAIPNPKSSSFSKESDWIP